MKKLLSYSLLLTLLLGSSYADDFVPEQEDDVTFSANNLTLDGDDTGGNIELQFGSALSESLQWDDANTRFSLSDSLDLQSNELIDIRIENLATPPTCGATEEGKIYFNTTDKLTYSCDGAGVWNPFENALNATIEFPVVQARRTTAFTLPTTYGDVDLDTTDLENDVTTLDHDDTLRDRIDIGATAMYQIIYGYTAGGSATATHEARARVRVNDATVLPGSESVNKNYQGEFSTTSASFLANLTDGDFISLQLQRDATTDITQDQIYFSFIKLEGIKGDPGPQGPAGLDGTDGIDGADGADGADGDITWEGAWVSQNYTANQAVSYLGSSYVCTLDTVSNEDPTDGTYWALLTAAGVAGSGTDDETFTIDQDNTGGNVTLQFGTTLAEFLTWDDTNSRFSLSDDIAVGGNIQQDGNTFTFDSDNIGAGANTSIVSEQGSDANGEIRYNATTNQWELSNDGGAFDSIATGSPSIAQVYQTTATVFNAVTAMPWDGTGAARVVDAGFAHSTVTNPSRVTVNNTGLHKVDYNISWDTTANARRTATCRFTVNGTVVAPAVGTSHAYARNNTDDWESNSASLFYNFTAGDYYEIQCQSTGTAGNITTLANESSTTIEFIR